jgi:hypothetical protein
MEHSSQIIYFATEAPIRFTTQEERRMGDCLDACLLRNKVHLFLWDMGNLSVVWGRVDWETKEDRVDRG